MKNSTKTTLDKHEKALDHTTAMIRLARLANAVAFTLQVQCDANHCPAADIKQRRVLFEVMLKLRSVGTVHRSIGEKGVKHSPVVHYSK